MTESKAPARKDDIAATGISRRSILAGVSALAAGAPILPAAAGKARTARRRPAPPGFLWGTAISAYQSEGNNINTDAWLMENMRPSMFKDRSGDACDSYHRFAEDIAIAADMGLNAYRLGIEWARIEPNEGEFSNAMLDHYARVFETCRAHGIRPIVTFNHFTVPLWFAARGGFEVADAPQIFARYCGKAAAHLGGLMHMATTFNEANIQLLVHLFPQFSAGLPAARQQIAAAGASINAPKFSRLAFADPALITPIMAEAHRQGYAAIKAARPQLPVGLTLTTQDVQAVNGDRALEAEYRARLYGDWVDVARSHADFFGVQTYTRFRVGPDGLVPPPEGAEMTLSGYEYYPQALANTIRWAHAAIGKPLYVTENGIGTDDDARRIAFIDAALDGVRECLDEGIAVHGYLHWSLLDNFEWTEGYRVPFGLVAVDRETFRRAPKPSAHHYAEIVKANAL